MAIQNLNSNVDFSFGEKLLSADANLIKQNADDIKVGSNITLNANVLINLASGTTYRTTGTAVGVHVIALPSAPPANSRFYLKPNHASAGNNFEIRVDNGAFTGTLVTTVGCSGTVEGWIECYWDGSTWRTANRVSGAGMTITANQ